MINIQKFDISLKKTCRNRLRDRYRVVILKTGYSMRGRKRMSKKWTVTGGILWIAGLAVFIIGLNLNGPTKDWMTVTGTIAFLIGLGIYGVRWIKQKDEKQ